MRQKPPITGRRCFFFILAGKKKTVKIGFCDQCFLLSKNLLCKMLVGSYCFPVSFAVLVPEALFCRIFRGCAGLLATFCKSAKSCHLLLIALWLITSRIQPLQHSRRFPLLSPTEPARDGKAKKSLNICLFTSFPPKL